MPQEHPIIPPPELIHEWQIKMEYTATRAAREALVTKVFQLGADMELEACCEWFRVKGYHPEVYRDLRKARRPKPPSLKEQALETLRQMHIDPETGVSPTALDTIRRALEQLND